MTALAVPMLILYYIAAGIALLTDRRRAAAGVDGLDYRTLDDDEASPLPGTAAPLDEPPAPLDDEADPDDRPDGDGAR
jgi:sec-independent protein translocase protein TatC